MLVQKMRLAEISKLYGKNTSFIFLRVVFFFVT